MTLRILAAIAVVLGLAACGGGGGGSSGPDKDAQQRTAVERAIDVAGERFIPLAGDPTEAEVKAAADAVAAARKALADADELSEDDRENFDSRISTLEDNLDRVRARIADADRERQLTVAEEARKLTAALSGTRITAISAAVTHEAAPVMSGTVPGTPAVSVADLETDATGVVATANGWKRGLYGVPDDAGALVDTVVLYTNIEAPGTRPFSGENGRYGDDNGSTPRATCPSWPPQTRRLSTRRASPRAPVSRRTRRERAARCSWRAPSTTLRAPMSAPRQRGAPACLPSSMAAALT